MDGPVHFTRRAALVALASLPLLRALAASAPTLEQIVDRHTGARGGAAALDRVKSLALDLEITEKGQAIGAHYMASVVPLVRIDIVVDGQRVYSEGVDSKGVWLWPGGEPAARDSVAEGAANALLHGAESNLVGLHRFTERGHKLALMPPEAIDGIVYQVIEVTYSTGHRPTIISIPPIG